MKIIGTGIDIVSNSRIKKKAEASQLFVDKILTSAEQEYCNNMKNYIQNIAGRFAVKEAIYKVLSARMDRLYFCDIEISSDGAMPVITENCRTGKYIKENRLGYSISISHEEEFSVGYSIFWEEQ